MATLIEQQYIQNLKWRHREIKVLPIKLKSDRKENSETGESNVFYNVKILQNSSDE